MSPKSEKESLVLLINIGVTRSGTSNNSTLVEKAKQVAKRKIEKMIFLQPKDEVAIIVMGSPITKNNLNTEHVEEFTDFQVPNWDLIQKLVDLQSTSYCSNWVEALDVAVEFLKTNICDVVTKKIILMSDFNEESDIISQFQADAIAERLLTERIELITIGESSLKEKPESFLTLSEVLLKDVHNKINSQHITFDSAISSLKFYSEIQKKPSPCYLTMELIDKKIPVVSYVKIDVDKFPPWKKAKGEQKLESKTEYVDRQRTTYTKDEIETGYKYGEVFILVEKEVEEAMSYKSGMKSYMIHSFTNRNNINLEYLYDSTTHVIFPSSKGRKDATRTFYSLVQAMHETNSVAIVRKVLRENCTPKMVALFPCIDVPEEPWCLVEIALTFAEDRRVMETRPIKSVVKQLTNEQNDAVDDLINSLMLPDIKDSYEVDGSQYFLPGFVPDPAVQHRWNMLSYRAMNPDKSLPSMEDYLKAVLEVPLVKERSKYHLKRIAELFQLESLKKEENHVQQQEKIDTTVSDNIQVQTDAEDDSFKKLFTSKDISADVDLDELAANI